MGAEGKSRPRFKGNIRKLRSLGRRSSALSPRPMPSSPPRRSQSMRTPTTTLEYTAAVCDDVSKDDGDVTADESSSEAGIDFETETTDSSVPSQELIIVQDPIQTWFRDANALLQSDEMAALASSSRELVCVTTGMVVRVAFLPVTLPLNAVTSTSSCLIRTCTHVTSAIAGQVFPSTVGEDTASCPPLWEALMRNFFGVAGRITDEIGSTVLHLVSPVSGGEGEEEENGAGDDTSPVRYLSSAGESSAEHESFLDRLRLDYPDMESEVEECSVQTPNGKRVSSTARSNFLLRAGDLSVRTEETENSKARHVYFIDLGPDHSEEYLTGQVLDSLVANGLALLSNSDECRVGTIRDAASVLWKPEGSTEKLLRKKSKMTPDQWVSRLEREVLIWSGRFKEGNQYGKQFPLFLAKGLIRLSPRQILRLLWDNKRTGDYNKWSVGRNDLLVIEDGDVLSTESTPVLKGTKIISSDTKVPFTGFIVTLSTLMHVRPLGHGEEGYVVVSRSLNTGRAGCHVHAKAHVDDCSKNEILWGVNVLRSVPGKPNVTDFTSVSHVGSSLVPGFLSKKIGVMGVEDFFSAVRLLEK